MLISSAALLADENLECNCAFHLTGRRLMLLLSATSSPASETACELILCWTLDTLELAALDVVLHSLFLSLADNLDAFFLFSFSPVFVDLSTVGSPQYTWSLIKPKVRKRKGSKFCSRETHFLWLRPILIICLQPMKSTRPTALLFVFISTSVWCFSWMVGRFCFCLSSKLQQALESEVSKWPKNRMLTHQDDPDKEYTLWKHFQRLSHWVSLNFQPCSLWQK